VHDARTAVVALDAVARLLTECAGPTSADRQRIETLMQAELNRLQHRLDPDLVEPIVEFSLSDALSPVLFAHQLCGAHLRCDLGELRAFGRPSATATVVANLLANARKHAPGASVDIRAVRIASHVVITIEDNGPGIPAHERAMLLRRGMRGSDRGLGLYTASTAMTSQSGTLRLGARTGGGTRITLSLPAPLPVAAGEPANVQAS
jgi:signal transduction histidine kinase